MDDEEVQNQGWDPAVKRYLRKIMNSIGVGLLWMMTAATAGLYFGLALPRQGWRAPNIIFMLLFVVSLAALVRWYWRQWK